MIFSDDHPGLKAARQAVFGSIPWQRCQFHLQQNTQAYIPRQEIKEEGSAALRAIFTASDRTTAEVLLRAMVAHYQESALRLSP